MGGPGSGGKRDSACSAEVVRLRAEGLTLAAIAKRVGVTRQTVAKMLKGPNARSTLTPPACPICGRLFPRALADTARGAFCLPCLAKRPDATFAQRLRSCRVAAGLTRIELYTLAGLPKGYFCRYECGNLEPSCRHLRRLAQALGPRLTLVLLGVGK